MSFTAPKFTNAGKTLLARVVAGECPLEFTSIAIGSGELGTREIANLTALVTQVKRCDLQRIKRIDTDTVAVKAIYQNAGLATGFYWREVGLYAKNPDAQDDRSQDILYCYQNAGTLAEYIPSASTELVDKIISMAVVVSDAENVTAMFQSELFTLESDFQDHLADANAHEPMFAPVTLYVDGTNGNDGTADGTQEKPFKTIQKALAFPRASVQNVTIKISAGAYNEDISVGYKQWAYLAIEPATDSASVSIKSAYFKNMAFVSLNKVSITGLNTSTNACCRMDYCKGVIINSTLSGTTSAFGFVAYGSTAVVKSCVFNNCKFAIYGAYSVVQSDINTGTGNITAYSCQSGQISYSQTDSIGYSLKLKQASGGGLVIDNTTGSDLSTGNYLKLTGGEMSGTISKNSTTSTLTIAGGNDSASAYCSLYGSGHATAAGQFSLGARKSATEYKQLIGTPDGILNWGGSHIVRSVNGVNADATGNVNAPSPYFDFSRTETLTKNAEGNIVVPYDGFICVSWSSGSSGYLKVKVGETWVQVSKGYEGGPSEWAPQYFFAPVKAGVTFTFNGSSYLCVLTY